MGVGTSLSSEKQFDQTAKMKLVVLALPLLFVGCQAGLGWTEAENGQIPSKAVKTKTFGNTVNTHFCKITGAQTCTGTIEQGSRECVCVKSNMQAVRSTKYKVLTTTGRRREGAYRYVWSPLGKVPTCAKKVTCSQDDFMGTCYLGASNSGDSICYEEIGVIDSGKNIMYGNHNGKLFRCPFYEYLC